MRITVRVLAAFIVVLSLYFVIRTVRQAEHEPTAMAFTDNDSRELKPEDLADYTGTVNWSIFDQKDIPEAAKTLLNKGREAGAAENFEKALRLFAQAAKIAPGWAYPIYESAFTHLMMNDLEKAERDYLEVQKLEPRGFFTYQSELDCVRRERSGEFKSGTCRTYVLLADMPGSSEKRALLQKLLDESPTLAPAWEKFAELCDTDQDKIAAIEKGVASKPDPHTRGTLLINKALILHRQGRHDEAITLLNRLVSDPDSSLDTVSGAKYAISNLSSRPNN